MYILIQTYTSHNSSINTTKTTKTNEKGYTEKERETNQNKKLSLPGKSKNIELTKLN